MNETTAITITEKQLTVYEDKIRKGLASFIDVGQSLQKIKEANGFKLRKFKTFDEYCQATFQFTERNGYRMIAAAQTAKKVEAATGEAPRNEASARVLREVVHDPKLIQRVNDNLKKVKLTIATATAEKLQEVVDKVKPQTRPMFEEPKPAPKPIMPELRDICPACNETPEVYRKVIEGWTCGRCGAVVLIGVISAEAKACPECGKALIGSNDFCENCGAILEVVG